jgi:hypothetical protein
MVTERAAQKLFPVKLKGASGDGGEGSVIDFGLVAEAPFVAASKSRWTSVPGAGAQGAAGQQKARP